MTHCGLAAREDDAAQQSQRCRLRGRGVTLVVTTNMPQTATGSPYRRWPTTSQGSGGPRVLAEESSGVLHQPHHAARKKAIGRSKLFQNREVVGIGDRDQRTRKMRLCAVRMIFSTIANEGRQFGGPIGNSKWLVDTRQTKWRNRFDFLLAQLEGCVEIGVADGSKFINSGYGQSRFDTGMIQHKRREVSARRLPRYDDRADHSVRAPLPSEPVQRGAHLLRDLRQIRGGNQRVAR
jgi:hypothetical protein